MYQKVGVPEHAGGEATKEEASSDYKLKNWTKDSPKSRMSRLHRPVNDRFRMALDVFIHCLLGRSPLYKGQVAKHVRKCTSIIKGQMSAIMFEPSESF